MFTMIPKTITNTMRYVYKNTTIHTHNIGMKWYIYTTFKVQIMGNNVTKTVTTNRIKISNTFYKNGII